MRSLLTLALILAPTAAFAYCPAVASADTVTANANRQAVLECQAAELRATTAQQQQKLELSTAIQTQQLNFDLQLRLQKTFDAASPTVTFPAF
jgi:parvulin-like peptidyl-prolyl isomerase